eukprot:TRINITY_DN5471_c0_g2_i1.p1 TRINITY_DN5471_c0_g2~~TRINITY_DN5471_c0_g2_i1.p1  ORF type:complete len:303 (-),score=31.29 TRINITY_DN5471_c0_g2_i1:640-1548(-)
MTSTTSGVQFKLHPLVLVNITDHYTRVSCCTEAGGSCRVIGCLLGQVEGRNIELVNSFEVKLVGEDKIDEDFLISRKDQFKQVFANLDILGWYSTGSQLQERDLQLQEKVVKGSQCEAPVYLLLDVATTQEGKSQDLPITLFETQVHVSDGVAQTQFNKVEFTIETSEAERIGVEQMSKVLPGGQTDSIDQLAQHLSGLLSAVKMLKERVLILQQIVDKMDGEGRDSSVQHGLIRQINNLIHSFPLARIRDFKAQQYMEYGETMLLANLSQMTQSAHLLLDVVDKYNVAYDKTARRGRMSTM